MEKIFNKLVRDKIPEIIENNGETPITRILSDKEYKDELLKKLLEEVNEVIKTNNHQELLEELADVYEVIKAIGNANEVSFEDIKKVANEKANKRGGFDDKVYLEKTLS